MQDYYHGMLPVPYDCILVKLEEGPTFLGNPKGFGCDDLVPDMPVKVSVVNFNPK